MLHHVFLSHSSKDKPFARTLAKDLSKQGIKVWIDEAELKIGDSLIDKLQTSIQEIDSLIVILTPESVSSNWVRKELELALFDEIINKKTKVLPVLRKKCEIPGFLRAKLYADMTTKIAYGKSIPKLIKTLIGRDAHEAILFDLIGLSKDHKIKVYKNAEFYYNDILSFNDETFNDPYYVHTKSVECLCRLWLLRLIQSCQIRMNDLSFEDNPFKIGIAFKPPTSIDLDRDGIFVWNYSFDKQEIVDLFCINGEYLGLNKNGDLLVKLLQKWLQEWVTLPKNHSQRLSRSKSAYEFLSG